MLKWVPKHVHQWTYTYHVVITYFMSGEVTTTIHLGCTCEKTKTHRVPVKLSHDQVRNVLNAMGWKDNSAVTHDGIQMEVRPNFAE